MHAASHNTGKTQIMTELAIGYYHDAKATELCASVDKLTQMVRDNIYSTRSAAFCRNNVLQSALMIDYLYELKRYIQKKCISRRVPVTSSLSRL